jgi:L-fuculokinase
VWFLGIDIGTTHIKVCGVGEDGDELEPMRVRTPVVVSDGLDFHDGTSVWETVRSLVLRYSAESAVGRGGLAGLTIGSFGQEEGFPVDAAGHPLHASLAWWEAWPERTLSEDDVAWFDSVDHYRVSGMRYRDNQTPDRLAHIRAHSPDAWSRAALWVDFGAFVGHRLTGRWLASSTQVSHSQLVDLRTLEPDPESLVRLDADARLLPAVGRPGERVGDILTEALPGVELEAGAAVLLGGHDQVMAAFADARSDRSTMIDSIGTAEYLMVNAPAFVPGRELWEIGADVEHGHAAGEYVVGWGLPTGKVLQTLAELLLGGDFERLMGALADGGPVLDLDFSVNDLRDPRAGLISIDRVPADSDPEAVVRSCVAQLSERVRQTGDRMAAAAGVSIDSVALTGSLFHRPELVAHRRRLWPVPLTVSTLGEAVASGSAHLARAAVLGRRAIVGDHAEVAG